MTLERIHLQTAQLDQSTRKIHTIGRQLSWDLMILHTLVEYSSSTSISQLTILSSQQRSTSLQESTIQILTPMVQSVWIFLKNSGHQLLQFQRCFFQSVLFWLMPTQMILWFQRLLRSIKMTEQNSKLLLENGQESMLCDWNQPDHQF